VFPDLLREREITTRNQVWAMDLTYLSMDHEFLCERFACGPGRPDPDMVYFDARPPDEAA